MKWNVGAKIGAGFLLAILVLLLIGLLTYRSISALVQASEWRRHSYQVLQHVERVLSLLKDAETGQRGFIITGEERYLDPYQVALREMDGEIATLRNLTSDNPGQQQRLDSLQKLEQGKLAELQETISLRKEKGFEDARMVVASDRGKQLMDQARDVISAINQEEERLLDERTKEAATNTQRTYATIIYGIIFAVVAMFGTGWLITTNIAAPLKQVTDIANRIAVGELGGEVGDMERLDEVGLLHNAFARMNKSLKLLAGQAQQIAAGDLKAQLSVQSDKDILGNAFATMTQNLRSLMQDVLEAVNVLVSSASEIMAAATQLASGATETATGVSQTTATVEEVKQTSQLSSEKGRQVADNAQNAAKVAQEGKESVEETIAGMSRIRNQMETIADSIVRLSEQSQAIGAIIATVDDLAAQSNLLAVNASIEAAKAGEHGKGFGVVAQEVKNLADQSKQATMQVRTILSDVQKATASAVLATEQGSKTVEAGVVQANSAGHAIRALNDTVTEAAQAATQIATMSQEQFVGMDQIALAMENIKVASTQTVASTKQAETAAHHIHELGQKLKDLINRFKV